VKQALETLESRYAEIRDLQHTVSILGWDQQTQMPRGGAAERGRQFATLSGLIHERKTAPELLDAVEKLERKSESLKPRQRRLVELAAREVRKATSLPGELTRELALAEARGHESWVEARANDDFAHFAPDLERIVELKREQAKLSAGDGPLYDALLDDFEPGATTAEIDPLLDDLRELTVPLVEQVRASKVKVDTKPLRGRFPAADQRAFVRDVVVAMGIDMDRARLDLAAHPFCGGIGPIDVRMTGRYDDRDLRPGLYGAIHEAGHGLYEQGLDPKRTRSPLGGAISMAIHESQSRLWENRIGRSRAFWKHFLPRARKQFPAALRGVKLDAMWRAANELGPSFIRVEADELTYNLHIILRYRLELELVSGSLEVRDLPERWNDEMHATLGIRPRNDADGCLQDVHWSSGAIGYFPTYSLGNLYAAQFVDAAERDLGDIDAMVARGDLEPLASWLREKIHKHDRTVTAAKLVKRVTGSKLSVEPFRRYITGKVEAIYG
jgi:carboxypeptidase Taq